MKMWSWILLAVIFVVLALTAVVRPKWDFSRVGEGAASRSGERELERRRQQEAERRLRREVEERTELYRRQNGELLQEFLAALPNAGDASFRRAVVNIESFIKRTTKMSFCTKLVYKMVKDKLTGDSSLSEALEPIVRDELCAPLGAGHAAVDNELRNFMLRLQENHNRYRADVMEIAHREDFQGGTLPLATRLPERLGALEQQVMDFAVTKTLTAVGVGLEAVFARSLYLAIRRVAAHAAAKLAGTASAAAVSAVADGPLPVGDIIGAVIGVAGTVWTGYDVYQVSVKLPKELRAELMELVRKTRSEALTEAEAQAREAVRKANEAVCVF